jgi:hypothetical protein
MYQIRVVDMEEEGGRIGPDLRYKEEVQTFSFACGRGMRVKGFLEHPIKLAGWDPNQAFFLNL